MLIYGIIMLLYLYANYRFGCWFAFPLNIVIVFNINFNPVFTQ